MRALLKRLWAARRAIIVYVLLILGGWAISELLQDIALPEMRPMNEPMIHRFVMWAFAAFVVAAAIPFVPGAEIGFTLLLLFGSKVAPLVYTGMVFALVVAYCLAAFLPLQTVADALSWLGLKKASDLVAILAHASEEERERLLAGAMPSSAGKRLLRNRYLVLAIALNTPGNSLLGGGGGLAFVAGRSGLFGFWPFLATVIVAVAPVPLIFLFA